jgi:cobalamin biosynthesis Co2+ chelatase CbiK
MAGSNILYAQDNYTHILQSIEGYMPKTGKVTIHQDPRIAALIGKARDLSKPLNENEQLRVSGYRVQVYAGGNSGVARQEAEKMGEKVKEVFPDMNVYTNFVSPRWLCRVGDYRSIEEADAAMRKIRATGAFREVAIVRDQIIIY